MPDTNLGYEKMKKMMMTLLLLASVAMGMRAQYFSYSGWGSPLEPGTPAWCWQQQQQINAQQNYMNYLSMQNLYLYRPKTLPVTNLPQVPYYGSYNCTMPTTTNSIDSEAPMQNTSRMRTRDARCTNCLGRGFNPKTMYMGNGQYRTVQDRCNFCHGRGTVKETFYE